LSFTYVRLGELHATLFHNPRAALAYFEQSREIRARLSAAAPENVHFASDLMASYDNLRKQHIALGNTHAAQENLEQSRELRDRLVAAELQEYEDHGNSRFLIQDGRGTLQASLGTPLTPRTTREDVALTASFGKLLRDEANTGKLRNGLDSVLTRSLDGYLREIKELREKSAKNKTP
jgi:hypothetical protein